MMFPTKLFLEIPDHFYWLSLKVSLAQVVRIYRILFGRTLGQPVIDMERGNGSVSRKILQHHG
jgi:hypothetical protein